MNKKTKGVITAMIQKAWPDSTAAEDNRGEVVVEFIVNWLGGTGVIVGVEPAEKSGTTWGRIKAQ